MHIWSHLKVLKNNLSMLENMMWSQHKCVCIYEIIPIDHNENENENEKRSHR